MRSKAIDVAAVPPGGQRVVVGAFIVAWLALQIGVPLVRKFEWPTLAYRPIRQFDWSMYSTPALEYEVSLYAAGDEGARLPVPALDGYVQGLRLETPGPCRLREPNYDPAHVEQWYQQLLAHIAAARGDGRTYCVEIDWIRPVATSRRAPFLHRVTYPRR